MSKLGSEASGDLWASPAVIARLRLIHETAQNASFAGLIQQATAYQDTKIDIEQLIAELETAELEAAQAREMQTAAETHTELRYPLPWRVGSKGKQTIYDASPVGDGGLPGRSLGRMDTPELAAFVVAGVNDRRR